MSTTTAKLPPMTADEFIAWAIRQPEGVRYELHHGEIVPMPNEAVGHMRTKMRVADRLGSALRQVGAPCEVFGDGVSVAVDDRLVFEPDATVRCGDLLPDEAVKIVDPLIVVEVLSPSTRGRDMSTKLDGYMRIGSLRHYLIVDAKARTIIHHERDATGRIVTHISHGESLRLVPPGIELAGVFD